MSEVLIDILKGNTESELTDKIYDFKNGLSKMNVVQIKKNTSVKNLTKYLPKGKQQRMFQFKSKNTCSCKSSYCFQSTFISLQL